jgi:hypothetical protein
VIELGVEQEGLSQSRATRYALVVSTNCDDATRALHDGALSVETLLRERGFEVITCFGDDATAASLYWELYGISGISASLDVVFVVAHGSERALFGSDGEPMFDSRTCELLRNSIMVANSCLRDGDLGQKYTSHLGLVRYFIGYSPALKVVVKRGVWQQLRRFFRAQSLDADIVKCSTTAIDALVKGRKTAREATNALESGWQKLAAKWCTLEPLVGKAIRKNAKAVRLWGSNEALVVSPISPE